MTVGRGSGSSVIMYLSTDCNLIRFLCITLLILWDPNLRCEKHRLTNDRFQCSLESPTGTRFQDYGALLKSLIYVYSSNCSDSVHRNKADPDIATLQHCELSSHAIEWG